MCVVAYILDALVILILGLSVWHGKKRGLVRMLVLLVGCVAALFLAGRFSAPIADWAYDTLVEPPIERSLVTQVQNAGETHVEIGLRSVLGDRAEGLVHYLTEQGIPESVTIGLPDLSEESILEATAPAMEEIVRPAVCGLLTAVAALILFLALLLVVELLARIVDGVFKLPLLKQVNQIGGVAVGVLQGVLWAMVFTTLLRVGVDCGLFGTLVTGETLNATTLTALLLQYNPLV